MRKWILLPALLLLLCGCAEKTEPETVPPETGTEPPVEYEEVVLHTSPELKIYDGVELTFELPDGPDSAEAEVVRQAAALFEADTGAHVNFSFGENEQPSDILAISGSELSGRRDALLDLTDFAAAADYENHSAAFLRKQVVDRCGSLKAIPWEPELWGIYYNREIMKANDIVVMPEDWETYMTMCSILRNKGYQIMALDEPKAALATTLHLERTFGWDNLKKLDKKSPELQHSLQEIIDFLNYGFFSGGWPETTETLQSRIGLRNTAMFVGSNRDCTALESAVPCDLEWGVFAYPGSGAGTGTAADSSVLAVSANCSEPEAAFEFIMLVTTGEFDQLRVDLTEGIPADPHNESLIAGAVQLLQKADRSPEVLSGELPLAIWQSQYKDGAKAAKAWQKP